MSATIIGLTLASFVLGATQDGSNAHDYILAEFDVFEGAAPISFFENGEMLAASYDRNKNEWVVMVWDVTKKELRNAFRPKTAHIHKLDSSPNNKSILINGDFGSVQVYTKDGQSTSRFNITTVPLKVE